MFIIVNNDLFWYPTIRYMSIDISVGLGNYNDHFNRFQVSGFALLATAGRQDASVLNT